MEEMVSMKWRIEPKEALAGDWYVSATLGEEWVDFPMNHENSLWLGRFIKHAALMEMSAAMHNTFCRVCTW